MLTLTRRLLEMIRFSHTVFALPFALLSAALAWRDEPFRWLDLVGILLCMVFARSAAMAFNRIADRRLDALNPRTEQRHLPAGTLSPRAAALFTLLCALGFVASTGLFLLREPPNPWPLYLAGPVLVFIGAYSFTKRFTILAHFWLGAALMLAPLAAWIAIRGLTDLWTPLVIGGAVLFWVAGFDILYACQDVDFDRKAKLSSVPARIGIPASLKVAVGCHIVMLGLLLLLHFVSPHLGAIYLIGLGAIAALLAYEHWLVRPDDLTRVNKAFFQVNGVISVGLLVLVLVQLAFSKPESQQQMPRDERRPVDMSEWVFSQKEAALVHSINRCPPGYEVRWRFRERENGQRPWAHELALIQVLRDEEVIHEWYGHEGSSFVIHQDRLYYPVFLPTASGGNLVAYDLSRRVFLWRAKIVGLGPVEHSVYWNQLCIRIQGDTVVLSGQEAAGRYVEVRNAMNGTLIRTVADREH